MCLLEHCLYYDSGVAAFWMTWNFVQYYDYLISARELKKMIVPLIYPQQFSWALTLNLLSLGSNWWFSILLVPRHVFWHFQNIIRLILLYVTVSPITIIYGPKTLSRRGLFFKKNPSICGWTNGRVDRNTKYPLNIF